MTSRPNQYWQYAFVDAKTDRHWRSLLLWPAKLELNANFLFVPDDLKFSTFIVSWMHPESHDLHDWGFLWVVGAHTKLLTEREPESSAAETIISQIGN